VKYQKSEKFHELTAMNNYEGLGQENFQALERGEEVELENAPEALVSGEYIQEIKDKK
tara:strand:+ start:157 stop:330 length:174 start_codon:yes stop_codon:yes gene_type:complete